MTGHPRYSQVRELHQSLVSQQGCSLSGPAGVGPTEGHPSSGEPACPGVEIHHCSLQKPQLFQLRAQIMAYRMLVRNQPLQLQLALSITGERKKSSAAQRGPPPFCSSSKTIPTATGLGRDLQASPTVTPAYSSTSSMAGPSTTVLSTGPVGSGIATPANIVTAQLNINSIQLNSSWE